MLEAAVQRERRHARFVASMTVNLMNCHPLKRPVRLDEIFPSAPLAPGARRLSEMTPGEREKWAADRKAARAAKAAAAAEGKQA